MLATEHGVGDTGGVDEYCTCGVKLPEDARFCHKCGKPQYEDPAFELASPPPVPVIPVTPAIAALPEISFQNSVAVRIAFVAASFIPTTMVLLLPVSPVFMFVIPLIAGFMAVWFYHKRTHAQVSIFGGARLGWITGIFWFVISLVLFTIATVTMGINGGFVGLKEQLRNQGQSQADIDQFFRTIQNPNGLAVLITIAVICSFVVAVGLPTLGAMLGAKVLGRDADPAAGPGPGF